MGPHEIITRHAYASKNTWPSHSTFNWKKNSQLRSRSLDSLAACKFSSHSSEHRRRSYELCILAQIGMQNNHVIHCHIDLAELEHDAAPASLLLSAYCACVSPERRAGTLRKWLYSLGCPQALGGKGPTRTIASRAWAAVTPSPKDCRPVTTDTLPLVLLGPPQFQLLPGPLILQ